MLGTQFPGHSGQVRALADLLEGVLIPRVSRLVDTLDAVHDEFGDHWTGQRAAAGREELENGRAKVRMLVEVMATCVDEFRAVADHLDAAQEAVNDITSMALEAELPFHEDMIRKPLPSDYGIQPGADRTDLEVQDAEKKCMADDTQAPSTRSGWSS